MANEPTSLMEVGSVLGPGYRAELIPTGCLLTLHGTKANIHKRNTCDKE